MNPLTHFLDPLPLIAVLRGHFAGRDSTGSALPRTDSGSGSAAQFTASFVSIRLLADASGRIVSSARDGDQRRRRGARPRSGGSHRDAACRPRRDPRGQGARDAVRSRRERPPKLCGVAAGATGLKMFPAEASAGRAQAWRAVHHPARWCSRSAA
jgi:hypothetical protein